MAKTYTAFSRNIGPDLKKEVPDNINIGAVTLSVDLTLEDAGYKKVTGSPVWLQKVNNEANKIVPQAIKGIVAEIKKANDPDERAIKSIVEKNGELAAKNLALVVKAALAAWIVDKKEYDHYKVKAAGKIVLGAIGVTASAASIALTAGAASPVAIIGLARSGMGLAQQIAKAAMDAEKVERLIRADMTVLTKAFAKNKDNKAVQNMKELGLAAIAATLNVDTPTINNCDQRIGLYGQKITGLKKDHEKFASSIYKMMDLQETLNKKFKQAKGSKNIEKAQKTLGGAEKNLDDLLKRVVAIGERIETGEGNYAKYSKFIEALKGGVSSWTKYSQIVMSLSISGGTAITGIVALVEKDFSKVEEFLTTAKDQISAAA